MGCITSSPSKPSNQNKEDFTRRTSTAAALIARVASKAENKIVEDDDIDKHRVVIVGFGVAAGYALLELRKLGLGEFDVAVIGNEPCLAYERPALSKSYLYSPNFGSPAARLPAFLCCRGEGKEVLDEDWYKAKLWTAYRSTTVTEVDLKNKIVRVKGIAGDDQIKYEKLVIATGAKEARLQVKGVELNGIFYLRNEADAAALVKRLEQVSGMTATTTSNADGGKRQMRKVGSKLSTASGGAGGSMTMSTNQQHSGTFTIPPSSPTVSHGKGLGGGGEHSIPGTVPASLNKTSAVILGGGYLAAELIAAFDSWGLDEVHVVFREERLFTRMPWPQVLAENLQESLANKLGKRLKYHPKAEIVEFLPLGGYPEGKNVGSVVLQDGTNIECDLVVVAIGSIPNGEDLFKGKLDFKNKAIVVDGTLRTQHKSRDVWAIGECARPDSGVEMARKMGQHAARSLYASFMQEPEPEPFSIKIYRYSRLEFSSQKKIVWQQFGEPTKHKSQMGKSVSVRMVGQNNLADKGFGAFWHDESPDKKVLCGFFCAENTIADDIFKKIKQAVTDELPLEVLMQHVRQVVPDDEGDELGDKVSSTLKSSHGGTSSESPKLEYGRMKEVNTTDSSAVFSSHQRSSVASSQATG